MFRKVLFGLVAVAGLLFVNTPTADAARWRRLYRRGFYRPYYNSYYYAAPRYYGLNNMGYYGGYGYGYPAYYGNYGYGYGTPYYGNYGYYGGVGIATPGFGFYFR